MLRPVFALLLLLSSTSPAVDHVLLIGGGPDLQNSQAQIEQNVMWARDVVRSIPGERVIHIYYTDGNDPRKDVTEWRPPEETADALQPLARVFNSYWTNGEHYRNHRLGEVAGGTEAGSLRNALTDKFQTLADGDRLLIVFNGHGTHDRRDPSRNAISLWNSSQMTASDLDSLLSRLAPGITVRFVFTQCYAGAFARLARPGTERCGFLAEAEDQPAEGCSAAVDMDAYEDYSTYFFAALAGKSRRNQPLAMNPDRNGDGRTSLREAHLYTLLASASSDLPRSTSEVFLEQWLPWYLRWPKWPTREAADSEYAALYRELAAASEIDTHTGLDSALRPRKRKLLASRGELEGEQRQLSREIPQLRRAIRAQVLERWPGARYPNTANYRRFLLRDLAAAQDYILDHESYAELAAKQDRYWELEQDLLEIERAITRLDRIRRLAHLAHIRGLFERFATDDQKQHYTQLLACEEQAL